MNRAIIKNVFNNQMDSMNSVNVSIAIVNKKYFAEIN